MLFFLIYPIILSGMMFWGLIHYTSVPPWLKIAATWVFFIIAIGKGWFYPENKISEIANRLKYQ